MLFACKLYSGISNEAGWCHQNVRRLKSMALKRMEEKKVNLIALKMSAI